MAYRYWSRLVGGVALLVALCPCSDVEHYPVGPAPLETPERVTDVTLSYDSTTGHAVMVWTAPRPSQSAQSLIRYEIRYVYDGELNWPNAQSVLDPPPPEEQGQPQEYRFKNPERGGLLRSAIVAIDDANRSSLPSDAVSLRLPGISFSGRVIHALTHEPIAGLDVNVNGSVESIDVTTDVSGRFEVTDIRPQQITVLIRNDPVSPAFFDLVQEFRVSENRDEQFILIPYSKTELYGAMSILSLLGRATADQSPTTEELRIWKTHPVPLYVPTYTNAHGIDYRQIAIDAATLWMNSTGIAIWELVDQPSSWGVSIAYKSAEEMGIQVGVTRHIDDADGFPLRSDIDIVNTFDDSVKVWRTMLHELGHTIRLSHLPRGYLMFASVPLPDAPTADEILIVQLIHGLANPTDLSIYREVGW